MWISFHRRRSIVSTTALSTTAFVAFCCCYIVHPTNGFSSLSFTTEEDVCSRIKNNNGLLQRFFNSVLTAGYITLLSSSSPCLAIESITELQCPETFSSQSLGIQNIIQSQKQSSSSLNVLPPSISKFTTTKNRNSLISYL